MSRRESERPGHTHAATNNKVLIWLRLLGLRPAARFAALAEIADAARSVNERPPDAGRHRSVTSNERLGANCHFTAHGGVNALSHAITCKI